MFIKRSDGLEDARRDVTLEDRPSSANCAPRIWMPGSSPRPTRTPLSDQVPGSRRAKFPQPYEPMLPTLTREVFQRNDWLYEPKLDGYRVLAFEHPQTEMEYANEEWMSKYDSRAQVISVVAGETQQLGLPMISGNE